jgi:hypothetical protein
VPTAIAPLRSLFLKALLIAVILLFFSAPAAPGGGFSGESTSVWHLQDQGDETPVAGESPHGGYDSIGNKCKVCHAVHLATGTFMLMRAATASDACAYCHVGDQRHSNLSAYTNPNNSHGIYPSNGHTIGSGPSIPDSSIRQWLEPLRLTAAADDDPETSYEWDLKVRRYGTERMKLFVYTGVSSGGDESYESGSVRRGPTLLTCLSCHQPHNAIDQVWKPAFSDGSAANGYKLLRSSPSGSLMSTDPAENPNEITGWIDGITRIRIRVPETVYGAANTGHAMGDESGSGDGQTLDPDAAFTTWTQWGAPDEDISGGPSQALSVWCADCHNLNIAGNGPAVADPAIGAAFRAGTGWDEAPVSRTRYHADRTHTAGTRLISCMSCHRVNCLGGRPDGQNDPGGQWDPGNPDKSAADCDVCHYGDRYNDDREVNDFPHSGADTSAKLLFDWYDAADGEALDQVCLYCHDQVGQSM